MAEVTRRGWLPFAAMSPIWGVPYSPIRVVVEEVSPATLVLARTALAALLLVPIAAARRELRPVLVRWRWLAVFAAVEIALPWVLLSSAETRVSSSLAGLVIAAVPLVGAVIVGTTGARERTGATGLAGLLLGLGGVAALVGLDLGRTSAVGFLELGGVVLGYAIGPVVLSRFLAGLPALGVVACSLAVSAVVYAPIVAVAPPATPPRARSPRSSCWRCSAPRSPSASSLPWSPRSSRCARR